MDVARVGIGDRRADFAEVEKHRHELRRAVDRSALSRPRLRSDGTIIVHSEEPGYREVLRFAAEAANLVGAYVHVITDDVPAAQVDAPTL